MQGAAVSLAEGGGHPLLDGKDAAQRRPTLVDTMGLELSPHGLDRLVGEHGNEQVALGPVLLVVIDRAQ